MVGSRIPSDMILRPRNVRFVVLGVKPSSNSITLLSCKRPCSALTTKTKLKLSSSSILTHTSPVANNNNKRKPANLLTLYANKKNLPDFFPMDPSYNLPQRRFMPGVISVIKLQ